MDAGEAFLGNQAVDQAQPTCTSGCRHHWLKS